MELKVQIKNNYGREMVYPICEKSKVFARISGHTTLTDGVIAEIKRLGYSFTVQSPKI